MNNNSLIPLILDNNNSLLQINNNINGLNSDNDTINKNVGDFSYNIAIDSLSGYIDFEKVFPENTKFYVNLKEIKSGILDYASVYAYTDETNYENIYSISQDDIGKYKIVTTSKNYIKIRLYVKFTTTGNNSAYFIFGLMNNNSLIPLILNNQNSLQNNLNLNKHTARIFKKVCCVGDSYTAGYIVDSEGTVHQNNENYAWPHYMSLITGNNYINCGVSGATSKTWQERNGGLDKATETGVVQAYLVGLALNDVDSTIGLPVGSSIDVGTENNTYYAQYSRVLRKLNEISPKAKIFVMTVPDNSAKYTPYNNAIREIANTYNNLNVHVLDLANYTDLYNISSITNDLKSGHYTAIGYEQFAEILEYIWSDYINNNITDFQDVAFLPIE